MSELGKATVTSLITPEGKFLAEVEWNVGSLVRFYMDPHKTIGMITEKIDENWVRVLWSEKREDFLTALGGRRLNYTGIAQQMFTVEPMPVPSGLVFYLDEMTKKGNENED